MSLYDWLVFIHIFSAILGMGPAFVMTFIVRGAKTMSQLRHVFWLRRQIHIFVMIGGTLLLITGIWMGLLQPALFQQGWYITSLILFLIALGFGPFVLKPRSTPVKQLLNEHKGEEIPDKYYTLSSTLYFHENVINVLFIIIIALMILKPF